MCRARSSSTRARACQATRSRAVRRVIEKAGVSPTDIELFIHGTTVSTNALIERTGTRVAFITNTGFRDVIFIQNANRRDLYSLDWEKPRPLAARHDCLEIDCRVDSSGAVRRALDPADVARLIERLEAEKIGSVAISFLFSYLNPAHELELAASLREALPELFISLSHEVDARWRENDRGHTTIADAYLKPMFSGYVANLERGLEAAMSPANMLVMKSNGGVVEAEAAALQPANFLVSGPVGGVLGGSYFAELAGIDDLMTIDIGGTSCDVSLVSNQELRPRSELRDRAWDAGGRTDGRHPHDRRWWRLHLLDRRGRPASRGPAKRRIDSRARLLLAGRE